MRQASTASLHEQFNAAVLAFFDSISRGRAEKRVPHGLARASGGARRLLIEAKMKGLPIKPQAVQTPAPVVYRMTL
jgi:hypothetical protein